MSRSIWNKYGNYLWVRLVGGSGYPNGSFVSNLTGGTGKLASINVTVAGGVVTGFSLANGGINYTNGDVLTIVILNSMGVPYREFRGYSYGKRCDRLYRDS